MNHLQEAKNILTNLRDVVFSGVEVEPDTASVTLLSAQVHATIAVAEALQRIAKGPES